MNYLTGQQVLDSAITLSTDQTAEFRQKMAVWLELVTHDLTTRRKWNFLKQTTNLTVSGNAITLPDDYLEFVDLSFSDSGDYSYIETATELTFDPEVPDGTTVDLTYVASVATISDTSTETVLPYYCKQALVMGVLSYLYTLDNEDSYAKYPQLYENEISKLKVIDNRYNAIPTYDDIGWPVRTRNTARGLF